MIPDYSEFMRKNASAGSEVAKRILRKSRAPKKVLSKISPKAVDRKAAIDNIVRAGSPPQPGRGFSVAPTAQEIAALPYSNMNAASIPTSVGRAVKRGPVKPVAQAAQKPLPTSLDEMAQRVPGRESLKKPAPAAKKVSLADMQAAQAARPAQAARVQTTNPKGVPATPVTKPTLTPRPKKFATESQRKAFLANERQEVRQINQWNKANAGNQIKVDLPPITDQFGRVTHLPIPKAVAKKPGIHLPLPKAPQTHVRVGQTSPVTPGNPSGRVGGPAHQTWPFNPAAPAPAAAPAAAAGRKVYTKAGKTTRPAVQRTPVQQAQPQRAPVQQAPRPQAPLQRAPVQPQGSNLAYPAPNPTYPIKASINPPAQPSMPSYGRINSAPQGSPVPTMSGPQRYNPAARRAGAYGSGQSQQVSSYLPQPPTGMQQPQSLASTIGSMNPYMVGAAVPIGLGAIND